ncbi:ATP-binding cassette domain-containing protein [Facklamia sp. P12945]|uniref:ATP-binding cassette domain-containing protein n=1 Tax=unclassified Facklamia TaxID=2622293 RepID=UPI003D1700A0
MLFGNLQPLDGKILIDNRELSYRQLREIIFYNSQFSNVFSDNYANNVTLFDSFTIKEEISLPEKHKNKILKSDNCSQLSGGQKQMIKLQRAILSQMPILLMDEPFSAMNSELEIDLTKKLVQLDKTIILVSHNTNPDYLNLFDEVIYL